MFLGLRLPVSPQLNSENFNNKFRDVAEALNEVSMRHRKHVGEGSPASLSVTTLIKGLWNLSGHPALFNSNYWVITYYYSRDI